MTPSRDGRERESRRVAATRPRDLGRPIPGSSRGSNLQELHELYEMGSPTRVSRSSTKSNRPSRKSNSGSNSRSVSLENLFVVPASTRWILAGRIVLLALTNFDLNTGER